MYLVKNIRTNEYRTIRESDKEKFYDLVYFFDNYDDNDNPIFNFEVITDEALIKEIVKKEFNSRGRGEEYNANMPSVSQIASKLYPLDLSKDKYLLRWQNNESIEVVKSNLNNESLSKGTYIHKILELFVTDRCARNNDLSMLKQIEFINKNKNNKKLQTQVDTAIKHIILNYCDVASKDEEILHKIPDFEQKRESYQELALSVLPEFLKNELIHLDCIYSEVFICIDKFVQGSIDLVCYRNGEFTVCDFKTTSSIDKKTGKRKFKTISTITDYIRQVALYYELLKKGGYLQSGKFPKFIIYQIHLIGKDYKTFEIPEDIVKNAIKQNHETLSWYWSIVK